MTQPPPPPNEPSQPPVMPGGQPYTLSHMMPPPVPAKGWSTGRVALVAAGTLVIGLCLGGVTGVVGAGGTDNKAEPADTVTVDRTVYVTVQAEAPAPTSAPTTTKPPPPPAPTIEDGTWTVGVDFPAGKYRPREAASEDCYWGIYKSGTNGDTIIANGIGGGRPTVTLKVGQDFESARCGTWVKIG